MSDAKDYLAKRAQELDLGREQALRQVRALLDQSYPGMSRPVSLNDGVLHILTPNASLAAEIRMQQVSLLAAINKTLAGSYRVERLRIQIRPISE